MLPSQFNVRVYGLWIYQDQLLVSDELIRGRNITKFPGGGLELGEGPLDCIIREFKEELDLEVIKIEHFYTTDFYLRSAFHDDHQIISIYYKVEIKEPESFKPENIDTSLEPELIRVRWIPINELQIDSVTLDADRRAVELLLEGVD